MNEVWIQNTNRNNLKIRIENEMKDFKLWIKYYEFKDFDNVNELWTKRLWKCDKPILKIWIKRWSLWIRIEIFCGTYFALILVQAFLTLLPIVPIPKI